MKRDNHRKRQFSGVKFGGLILLGMILATGFSFSQDRGSRRTDRSERSWEMAKVLHAELTAEQKAQLFEKLEKAPARSARNEGMRGRRLNRSGNGVRGQRAGLNRSRAGVRGPLNDLLTEEQQANVRERMQQQREARRPAPEVNPAMREALGLNDDQVARMNEIRTRGREEMNALREEIRGGDLSRNEINEKMSALQAKHQSDLDAVLSAEQVEIMKIHEGVVRRSAGSMNRNANQSLRDNNSRGNSRRGTRAGMRSGRRR